MDPPHSVRRLARRSAATTGGPLGRVGAPIRTRPTDERPWLVRSLGFAAARRVVVLPVAAGCRRCWPGGGERRWRRHRCRRRCRAGWPAVRGRPARWRRGARGAHGDDRCRATSPDIGGRGGAALLQDHFGWFRRTRTVW